ncbi:unnamed protein product (macronuclear) [Paramecium tetraurelia]|uniref:Uncharacterized protein n=1 Tax=Paramecium tetraurelia TaxID=5888 RepID=A0CQQ4_PARTE|nr:uncharacterized protein GSPATT00009469001 [Paramecium tetraurelia]CAK73121.1 unnamed protein product [Paramecium tetraurelia]|eukprot:XP_001440518.1 hypothetical protein (macronuclear) [Paramecium tetraurelia strain d4-2]
MWRWNSQMIEERTQSRYQSFPENPEIIREKERDYKKRYGYSPYPNKQILYKVTETECKQRDNIKQEIFWYIKLGPFIFGSQQGAQVIQASQDSQDTVNKYLKLSKKAQINKQRVDEEDEEDESKLYQQAKVFRRLKCVDGNHLNINMQNVQNLEENQQYQQ